MALKSKSQRQFFSRGYQPLNIDISYRCPLECPQCGRQRHFRNNGQKVPGKDLSLENFEKIAKHFKLISFCGQYSDPVHHPRFIDFLDVCKKQNVYTEVSTASSFKSKDWFVTAFKTYPKARWIFGIDGMPEQSHHYRKNQNGKKLFEIMCEAKKHLVHKPIWQFIIFSFNENHIDDAIQLAGKNLLEFKIINSARWDNPNDPLKPSIRR